VDSCELVIKFSQRNVYNSIGQFFKEGGIMSIDFSIIIPCYNEGGIIGYVIEELQSYLGEHLHRYEILIIDDGSTDSTPEELAGLKGVRVIRHRANRGYGAAVKTGVRQAAGSFLATYDGDGQHYPEDLVKLLKKIKEEDWALVVGARTKTFHSNLWRMPGKWVLGWLANYLTKTKIPDLNSGLRAFKRDIISRYLHLCSDRFSFSTTSTLVFLNRGYPMTFVPIEVKKRTGKSSVNLMTGYDTVFLIIRTITLFNPLRIYMPTSITMIVVGTIYGLYLFFTVGLGLSVGALLIIFAGILLFFFGLLADQISELRKEKYE
jgi:glycosyltransferase involved in cell wall biosynthesis